jgi:hypothetical protein
MEPSYSTVIQVGKVNFYFTFLSIIFVCTFLQPLQRFWNQRIIFTARRVQWFEQFDDPGHLGSQNENQITNGVFLFWAILAAFWLRSFKKLLSPIKVYYQKSEGKIEFFYYFWVNFLQHFQWFGNEHKILPFCISIEFCQLIFFDRATPSGECWRWSRPKWPEEKEKSFQKVF